MTRTRLSPEHEPALRVGIIAAKDAESRQLADGLERLAFTAALLDDDAHLDDLAAQSREPFTQICIVDAACLTGRPAARRLVADLRQRHPHVPVVIAVPSVAAHDAAANLPFEPDAQLPESATAAQMLDILSDAVSLNLARRLRCELAAI